MSAMSPAPTAQPRVVSLLPWLTDLLSDLSLSHLLVGVSHDCASPLPSLTHPKLPVTPSLTALDITSGWRAATALTPPDPSHHLCSFYHVDIPALLALRPTHILTHLPSPTALLPSPLSALQSCTHATIISPPLTSLSDVRASAQRVAATLSYPHAAGPALARLGARLARAPLPPRTRVAVVQWPDPLYVAGDWVPGAVRAAGGVCVGVREGEGSRHVARAVVEAADVVVFAVCAVGLEEGERMVQAWWRGGRGRVVVVDGNRLFSRAAPGAVGETVQCLREILLERDLHGMRGSAWREWLPPSAGGGVGVERRVAVAQR